ncbi:unnamed protein product [Closterium sp. NIES-65]|nr:unnamed protein product [Closterium sp. NIES-65]
MGCMTHPILLPPLSPPSASRFHLSPDLTCTTFPVEDSKIDIGDFFKGDLPKKFLMLLGLLALSRVGIYIPLWGVDISAFQEQLGEGSFLATLDTLSGGGIGRLGLFSLGIVPYINAQIVFQLLGTLYPKIGDLQKKEGEAGRKKAQQYMKYMAVVFGALQAIGQVAYLQQYAYGPSVAWAAIGQVAYLQQYAYDPSVAWAVSAVSGLTLGSVAVILLGDKITDLKLGNGTSLLIFTNIVSYLPASIGRTITEATEQGNVTGEALLLASFLLLVFGIVYVQLGNGTSLLIFTNIVSYLPASIGRTITEATEQGNVTGEALLLASFLLLVFGIVYVQVGGCGWMRVGAGGCEWVQAGVLFSPYLPASIGRTITEASEQGNVTGEALLLTSFLLLVFGIVYVQEAERRIPINYASRYNIKTRNAYLPFKVNSTGVMPIIFSSSLLAAPYSLSYPFPLYSFTPFLSSTLFSPSAGQLNGSHANHLLLLSPPISLLHNTLSSAPLYPPVPPHVNSTGVMPIIFSSSLLAAPFSPIYLFPLLYSPIYPFPLLYSPIYLFPLLYSLLPLCRSTQRESCPSSSPPLSSQLPTPSLASPAVLPSSLLLRLSTPEVGLLYLPANVALIAFFNYFYTFLQLDPADVSDQLKRQGASVPNTRPGKATAALITKVLTRISVLGSAFLGTMAAAPALVEGITHLTAFRGFAGTSILILVGCATDTARKVQAELVSQKYRTIELDDISAGGGGIPPPR